MDEKTLTTLEYPKILERLAQYAAFSASAELIRAMRPTNDLELALQLQRRTSEARLLLSVNADVTVGGATDIRPLVDLAGRGGVLQAAELLEVKNTLMAARSVCDICLGLGSSVSSSGNCLVSRVATACFVLAP